MTAELGLEDVVQYDGVLPPEHVHERLAQADIFCLTSLWEGMPGSVMEAMISALPVVVRT